MIPSVRLNATAFVYLAGLSIPRDRLGCYGDEVNFQYRRPLWVKFHPNLHVRPLVCGSVDSGGLSQKSPSRNLTRADFRPRST